MLPATLAAVVLSQMSVCLAFSYTLLLLKFGAAGYTVVVAPFTIPIQASQILAVLIHILIIYLAIISRESLKSWLSTPIPS